MGLRKNPIKGPLSETAGASGVHVLWLRAYLLLNLERLALLNLDEAEFATIFDEAYERDAVDLALLVRSILERADPNPRELLSLYAYVCQCENAELQRREESLSDWFHPIAKWNSHKYVALDLPEVILRANDLTKLGQKKITQGIPSSAQHQASAIKLNFRFAWCLATGELPLSFDRAEELAWPIHDGEKIRIGVASWINEKEVDFEYLQHPWGDSKMWARCRGPKDLVTITTRLDCLIREAAKLSINVLVFPELTMSESLLRSLLSILDSIDDEHQIFMIVAGSSHEPTHDEKYANRSRIFSGMGKEIWTQDKIATFDGLFDGTHCYEPPSLGRTLAVRESNSLGRVAVTICSDFCNRSLKDGKNTPLWNLLAECRPSLTIVPSMQHNGDLERFETSAKILRDAHWGSSVVSNIQVTNRHNGNLEASSLVWAADSSNESRPKIHSFDSNGYIAIYELTPISSQELVNYKTSK